MTKPIWGIPEPPEQLFSNEVAIFGDYWHLPESEWEEIRKKMDGYGQAVFVLDTGVVDHQLLPERIYEYSEVPGESPRDGNAHGTHCSGTAVGREGIGVAHKADLGIIKVLSNRGSGGSDGIARGVKRAVDNGATVISLSLGGGGFYRPMQEACQYAWDNGCAVIAAAGNESSGVSYPAVMDECIAVAASDQNNRTANFSNRGPEVDVACPGVQITSCSNQGGRAVRKMSGTSMACPFFAGIVACGQGIRMRLGYSAWKSPDDIRKWMKQPAFTTDIMQPGEDIYSGSGLPNAAVIATEMTSEEVEWQL